MTARQITTLTSFISTSKELLFELATSHLLPTSLPMFYQENDILVETVDWRVSEFGDITFKATLTDQTRLSVTFNSVGSSASNIFFGGYISEQGSVIEAFTGCITAYTYSTILTLVDSSNSIIETKEISQMLYQNDSSGS